MRGINTRGGAGAAKVAARLIPADGPNRYWSRKQGVLTIRMKKTETERAKRIAVKGAEQ